MAKQKEEEKTVTKPLFTAKIKTATQLLSIACQQQQQQQREHKSSGQANN